jgi:hypothetical protein
MGKQLWAGNLPIFDSSSTSFDILRYITKKVQRKNERCGPWQYGEQSLALFKTLSQITLFIIPFSKSPCPNHLVQITFLLVLIAPLP